MRNFEFSAEQKKYLDFVYYICSISSIFKDMGLNQLWFYKDHFRNLRFDKTMSEKAKMDLDDQNFALGKKVANEKSVLSHLGQSWCKLV